MSFVTDLWKEHPSITQTAYYVHDYRHYTAELIDFLGDCGFLKQSQAVQPQGRVERCANS